MALVLNLTTSPMAGPKLTSRPAKLAKSLTDTRSDLATNRPSTLAWALTSLASGTHNWKLTVSNMKPVHSRDLLAPQEHLDSLINRP